MPHFFRQLREIVRHLADIVVLATKTGDAGTHVQTGKLDKLGLKTAGLQDRLNRAVRVAVLDGTA